MVEKNWEKWADAKNQLIISYFRDNLPQFSLKHQTNYGPFWGASFTNQNEIEIICNGESDGFYFVIQISNEQFPLWKFDKSVNNSSKATDENILYQLTILNSMLK